MNKSKKRRGSLNVERIMNEFNESEKSPAHRKGTFKIEAPFDQALNTILKSKPEPKRKRHKK